MLLAEFDFEESPLQFYKAPNGEPVVSAASLVNALKGNPLNAARIVKNNVRSKWIIEIPNPNGGKAIVCLFEPGAYQIAANPMFQTELAERFQDFLFENVLPKLRANGYYINDRSMPVSVSNKLQELIEAWKANNYNVEWITQLYDATFQETLDFQLQSSEAEKELLQIEVAYLKELYNRAKRNCETLTKWNHEYEDQNKKIREQLTHLLNRRGKLK